MKFSFCSMVSILLSSFLLVSCAGSKSDSGSGSAGSSDTSSASHIVGSNPASYNEQSDSGNGSKATGEATNYTVDSEGLIISGVFNAGSSLSDFYQFHTGNFERVSVQVFVDGQAISTLN